MYRVLIVDDEKNIREGIRCKCDWAKIQIDHVDTAANGEEALRIMEQTCPDIVLTDIKMPGINGLELLKTISEHYPYTLTVVLSGYDEFELARDAMQYNAQKYILKPCNIEEIHDTVLEMVAILEDRAQRRRLEAAYGMAEEKKRQMAIRSCILGESIVEQHPILAYDSFCTEKLRLLLYQVYGDVMIRQGILEQLRSTLESFFDLRRLTFLCDVVGEKVIVCTQYYAYGILKRELLEIQSIWRERHSCRLQVAVSEMTDARTIAQSSQNLYKCLAASFFQEETDIITTFDKPAQNQDVPSGGFAPRDILSAIQRGDEAGIESCLEELFQFLNNPNFDIAKIKAYAVEVYLSVRRRADVNGEKTSQNEVDEILKSSSLCGIKRVFQREMHKMAQERRQRNQYSGNKLIYK